MQYRSIHEQQYHITELITLQVGQNENQSYSVLLLFIGQSDIERSYSYECI